jgi:hypothetical protein
MRKSLSIFNGSLVCSVEIPQIEREVTCVNGQWYCCEGSLGNEPIWDPIDKSEVEPRLLRTERGRKLAKDFFGYTEFFTTK